MDRIIEKFNFGLVWKDNNCFTYANDSICLCLSNDGSNIVEVKIDYVKTFTRWSNAFYCKFLNLDNEHELNALENDITKILKDGVGDVS